MSGQLRQLQLQHDTVAAELGDLQMVHQDTLAMVQNLTARNTELVELLETYQCYREDAETERLRAEHLELELENLREHCGVLQARLSILEPSSMEPTTEIPINRTLLSEIDDRRMELDMQNKDLNAKHTSLLKAHHYTVHQQERMKMHIARMSQIAQRTSSETRMQMLEQALAQSESDKTELELRVAKLQRSLQDAQSGIFDQSMFCLSGDDETSGESSVKAPMDSASEQARLRKPRRSSDHVAIIGLQRMVETMRLRIDQGDNEIRNLQRELETQQLVKRAEQNKSAKLMQQLTEQSAELERIQAVSAQLSFELESIRLESKKAEIFGSQEHEDGL
eukprot:jgi/Hompol1/3923/HPOL_000720-RA